MVRPRPSTRICFFSVAFIAVFRIPPLRSAAVEGNANSAPSVPTIKSVRNAFIPRASLPAGLVSMGRSAYLSQLVARLSTAVYEALLDFVEESDSVDSARPFPEPAVETLRRAIPCDVISYREWSQEQGTFEEAI